MLPPTRIYTMSANALCKQNLLMGYAPNMRNTLYMETCGMCYAQDLQMCYALDLQICPTMKSVDPNLLVHTTNNVCNQAVFLSKHVMPIFFSLGQTSSCFMPTLT